MSTIANIITQLTVRSESNVLTFNPRTDFPSSLSAGERYDLCGTKIGELIPIFQRAQQELVSAQTNRTRIELEEKDGEEYESDAEDSVYYDPTLNKYRPLENTGAVQRLVRQCAMQIKKLQDYQKQIVANVSLVGRVTPISN